MSTMKRDADQNEKNAASLIKEPIGEVSGEKKPENRKRLPKKGLRWTAIDTFILLIVLLAIAGAVVRSFVNFDEKSESEVVGGPYYVEFTVREIHTDVLAEFEISDRFYLYETGEFIGYLGYYANGERALKATSFVEGGNGALVAAEGCLYCSEGTLKNGGLLLKDVNSYLVPGAVLRLRTDRAVMTVEITKIRSDA